MKLRIILIWAILTLTSNLSYAVIDNELKNLPKDIAGLLVSLVVPEDGKRGYIGASVLSTNLDKFEDAYNLSKSGNNESGYSVFYGNRVFTYELNNFYFELGYSEYGKFNMVNPFIDRTVVADLSSYDASLLVESKLNDSVSFLVQGGVSSWDIKFDTVGFTSDNNLEPFLAFIGKVNYPNGIALQGHYKSISSGVVARIVGGSVIFPF